MHFPVLSLIIPVPDVEMANTLLLGTLGSQTDSEEPDDESQPQDDLQETINMHTSKETLGRIEQLPTTWTRREVPVSTSGVSRPLALNQKAPHCISSQTLYKPKVSGGWGPKQQWL